MDQITRLMPILKWAGGKRWLSAALEPWIKDCRGTYFEPFLGSAAVFLYHRPKPARLSDLNADLIECYLALREEHEEVRGCLASLAQREPDAAYYDIRDERPPTRAARAARFLYLNRTCWNGLYRVNLRGDFNVPRGTKTQILLPTDDFNALSSALQDADIKVADFEASISQADEGDVVFADPPYTVAHNMNGFIKYNQKIFTWKDQERLADALKQASSRGATVLATNADHPDVRRLYEGEFHASSLSRASVIAASANNRRVTTELFLTNRLAERI